MYIRRERIFFYQRVSFGEFAFWVERDLAIFCRESNICMADVVLYY